MPKMTRPITMTTPRSYDVFVPPNPIFVPPFPPQPTVPAIIVFHGGGQDIRDIERVWGLAPGMPPPALLQNYLLVFPETDPTLDDVWVHHHPDDHRFPKHDLEFLATIMGDITTNPLPTGNPAVPNVTAASDFLYVAGFSSGAGMVWQVLNHDLGLKFKGFAAVGNGLDPAKVAHYQQTLGGAARRPKPMMFIMGTTDKNFRSPATLQEVPIEQTYPSFGVMDMLSRNLIPAGPATTQLLPGSGNMTEVVGQLFTSPVANGRDFSYVTVINGGHNWPTPGTVGNPPVATHFNATEAIIKFWKAHARLP